MTEKMFGPSHNLAAVHFSALRELFLLTALVVLLSGRSAAATEWVPLPNEGNGDQYYYDQSKLVIKDDEVTYWKKVMFRNPQNIGGKEALSGLLRERMHCTNHTATLMSYIYYAADGATVQHVANYESEPTPIVPDTVGDAFESLLCPVVWQKQEEARIHAEQKAVETELKEAAPHAEEKKPAPTAPAPPKQPNVRIPQKPATPLPMPQIMDQLY